MLTVLKKTLLQYINTYFKLKYQKLISIYKLFNCMQKLLDYPNYTKIKVHMYLHMYIYIYIFTCLMLINVQYLMLLPALKIGGEILWEYIIL